MMRKIIEKEIHIILKQLFILKDDQKSLITDRVELLPDAKLLEVESLLLKLYKTQTDLLAEHLKENPRFLHNLSSLKNEVEAILKKEKYAKIEEDTKRKILDVLEKINSL